MTRHIPIQDRMQTFKVVASLRRIGKSKSFDVLAHDAREALQKVMIPENQQAVWLELGDGELIWEVQEDFI